MKCPQCGSLKVYLQELVSGYKIYDYNHSEGDIPVFREDRKAEDVQGDFWLRCCDCIFTDTEFGLKNSKGKDFLLFW